MLIHVYYHKHSLQLKRMLVLGSEKLKTDRVGGEEYHSVLEPNLHNHVPTEYYHLQDHFSPATIDVTIPDDTWRELPVNGAFLIILRTANIADARSAMRSIEDRFNSRKGYPWIIIHLQPVSQNFRRYVSKVTSAPVFIGSADANALNYPSWIDIDRAERKAIKMNKDGVDFGGSISYRQQLRYRSGIYVHHPLLTNVRYIWHVEPHSSYTCDIYFDPFQYMQENNKVLGFSVSKQESPNSMSTFWDTTQKFMDEHPEMILPSNTTILPWMMDEDSDFNFCQLWSHFQIIDATFLRSPQFQTYFKYLDRAGGFFYERWTDSAVVTAAAAMFLESRAIHFFDSVGYSDGEVSQCPLNKDYLQQCSCDTTKSYDFDPESCTISLFTYIGQQAVIDSMAEFVDLYMYDEEE